MIWEIALDREHPIRDGVAALERHNIDPSGSRFEKSLKKARELDKKAYPLSGAAISDRRKLQNLICQRDDLRARKEIREAQGLPTLALGDARFSILNAMSALQERLEAAEGAGGGQKGRSEELARLRRNLSELQGLEARARLTPGGRVSTDLEDRLDALVLQVDVAEAEFEAGAVELAELSAAQRKAEVQARSALATTLRTRALAKIAETITECMAGKAALYMRRPGKVFPVGVLSALFEAKGICTTSDQLTGQATELAWLAEHLNAALCAIVLPEANPEDMAKLRRPRPGVVDPLRAEPLMAATL